MSSHKSDSASLGRRWCIVRDSGFKEGSIGIGVQYVSDTPASTVLVCLVPVRNCWVSYCGFNILTQRGGGLRGVHGMVCAPARWRGCGCGVRLGDCGGRVVGWTRCMEG
jgi:hypothetical protein